MSESIRPGDVISYMTMCSTLGVNLQRGMNFRLKDGYSVILMSLRPGAPYADRIEQDGRVLIYGGHDASKTQHGPDPKTIDQPALTPKGSATQNKRFADAVEKYRNSGTAEIVKVYGFMKSFAMGFGYTTASSDSLDYWKEESDGRKVYKFKLELTEGPELQSVNATSDDDDRVIPSSVKLEVWTRDKGRCTKCGATSGFHFDHIIPYSKGGLPKILKISKSCADGTT